MEMTLAAKSTPRRVFILHNVMWAHYKGAVFSELAAQAPSSGFAVHVAHLAETDSQRMALGASVDRSIHRYPYEILFDEPIDSTTWLARGMKAVGAIRRFRPQIVIVSGYYDAAYWFAAIYCRLTGRKLVVAVDSTRLDHKRLAAKEAPKRVFLKLCHAAFGYGTRSREYCCQLGMLDSQVFTRCQAIDSTVLTQAFNVARASRDNSKRAFVYVGRLSPEKNLTVLLDAFAQFRSRAPDDVRSRWSLEFVGGGPQKGELEAHIADCGYEAIKISPGVDWRDVAKVYARSDVLILPSISEPWGLVVNEAMACGLPVLVSDRCGCAPDLVLEGQTGFTFPALDVNALAVRMAELANDDSGRDRMGRKAQDHIAQFTPSTAARQMIEGLEYVSRLP
jgi:glycosyltransferase involved in cell wall biosynthesis